MTALILSPIALATNMWWHAQQAENGWPGIRSYEAIKSYMALTMARPSERLFHLASERLEDLGLPHFVGLRRDGGAG